MKETGLSFQAEGVLTKLKRASQADGWHRIYAKARNGEMALVDALTEAEIDKRAYKPTESQHLHVNGETPAGRDVVRYHTTADDDYDDVWIGERLE